MTTVSPIGSTRGPTSITAPSIRRDQLWIPAGILFAALVVLAGWLLFVSPQRQQSAELTTQTAATTTRSDALAKQLDGLAAQNKDLARFQADLAAARQALPATSALPDFLRVLQSAGTATGVEVSAMSATPPTAVTATGAPSTGSSAANLFKVTISVTAAGSYDGLAAFVAQLQQTQPRAVLITSATEQASGPVTTLSLALDAFLSPGPGTAVTAGS